MNEKGKKCDVIVDDCFYTDLPTGVSVKSETQFVVWADESMKTVIESVEGVVDVYASLAKTRFSVYIDRRYDIEFIKREVEASIKCAGE